MVYDYHYYLYDYESAIECASPLDVNREDPDGGFPKGVLLIAVYMNVYVLKEGLQLGHCSSNFMEKLLQMYRESP